jgi:sulfate adenylyltransferase subunit 1
MAKAVSWRVIASTDTFILAYVLHFFFTGAKLAAAIALCEIPTKLVIYYGHERIHVWLDTRREKRIYGKTSTEQA